MGPGAYNTNKNCAAKAGGPVCARNETFWQGLFPMTDNKNPRLTESVAGAG
jgi:hypothetical protein